MRPPLGGIRRRGPARWKPSATSRRGCSSRSRTFAAWRCRAVSTRSLFSTAVRSTIETPPTSSMVTDFHIRPANLGSIGESRVSHAASAYDTSVTNKVESNVVWGAFRLDAPAQKQISAWWMLRLICPYRPFLIVQIGTAGQWRQCPCFASHRKARLHPSSIFALPSILILEIIGKKLLVSIMAGGTFPKSWCC